MLVAVAVLVGVRVGVEVLVAVAVFLSFLVYLRWDGGEAGSWSVQALRWLLGGVHYALAAVGPGRPHAIELWNIQDCRRSSLWRLRIGRRSTALHVARSNREAGALVAMGKELRALDMQGAAAVIRPARSS